MVSRRLDGRQNGLAGHQRKRSGVARQYPRLCGRGAAQPYGRSSSVSLSGRQGYSVPRSWDQSAREHRQGYILGLHSHDQRGRDRPLQSSEDGHDRGGSRTQPNRLVAPSSTMGLECSWRAPAHEETPAPLRPKRILFPRLW
jgi:hypothetical protein